MKLIKSYQPIPYGFHVVDEVDIPAIDPDSVVQTQIESIDITTAGDTFRRYLPGEMTIEGQGGKVLFRGDILVGAVAMRGGGRHLVLQENPYYDCQTRKQWERAEEHKREMLALECSEYED